MKSVLVLLSGGLDSTVALYQALGRHETVEAVSFTYGQRHAAPEGRAAKRFTAEAGIKHHWLSIAGVWAGCSSALVGGADVPTGERPEAASQAATVVPFRNGVMLSIAASLAQARGLSEVIFAGHASDHAVYADCRPEFLRALGTAILHGSERQVVLISPFVGLRKHEVVRLGVGLDVPLDKTYSCYQGGEVHCGRCGACVSRREAFAAAGVEDVTPYEAAQ